MSRSAWFGIFSVFVSLSFALGRGVAQPMQIDPSIDETVQSTLTLPDGRILASTRLNAMHNRARVVRLLPDGRLDPTFAPSYYYGAAPALALTSDGRVVVWGDLGPERGHLIARLLADGSVDSTFQEPNFGPGFYRNSRVLSLVVTPDDSLVFVLEPGTASFFGLQLH
ncbi:MAG: delta-60 repeat domain-containing protein, partial [Opitutaceae bacterium]